jgi:hypothetical protein
MAGRVGGPEMMCEWPRPGGRVGGKGGEWVEPVAGPGLFRASRTRPSTPTKPLLRQNNALIDCVDRLVRMLGVDDVVPRAGGIAGLMARVAIRAVPTPWL